MKRLAGRWRMGALLCALLIGLSVDIGAAASLTLTSQALTPYRTCTLTATPVTTTIVADAAVQQATPAGNFGALTSMNVASGVGVNRRIYVRFDLSQCSPAIPSSAVLRLATLRLFSTALPAVCRTIDLFRVTAAWGETTITWNNQPFGTVINNPPTAGRSGSFDVGTPVGCQNATNNTYVSGATLTGDVAAFVAGTSTNFGWMLRDDVENSATTRTWTASTKELGILGQAPQLIVTYVTLP
ncbi:MAG: DNRLRE domain-containing protein [Chloroflexota bacterium]|nr:DNRLRE domain-containing protein [Chloroflexota bacterium]